MRRELPNLDRQIAAAHARLQQIQQQAGDIDLNPLLVEAMAELSISLEELEATTEELYAQNAELLATRQALIAEHQRYQGLFDFAPDAYLVTNGQGVIQSVNGAAEGLFNLQQKFAQNKPLILFIAESDHSFIYAQLDRIAQSAPELLGVSQPGKRRLARNRTSLFSQDREVLVKPRNQKAFPAALSLSAEWNDQGTVVHLYWLFRDLRQRKQAEAQLRTSEERLRLASEAANFGVYEYSPQTNHITWSPILKAMHGLPADAEIRPENHHEFVHPEDQAKFLSRIRHFMDQASPGLYEHEFRIIRTDGEVRWLLDKGRVFFTEATEHRQVERVIGVIYDITDRKRSEAALRESEARLQSIVNLVPDLLWDSEPDGLTNWYNQRWMEYTGQTFEQAIGWGWTDAFHPDDREGSARRYREAVEQKLPLQQECRIRRHDGAYRWFVVKASPLKDGRGKVTKMYGAATDIHEQRVALEALRESEAKYRSLFESMEEGFCTAELLYDQDGQPVDHRFLEANPAFERQTNLANPQGRLASELMPGLERFWNDLYARIIATGESERIEQYSPAFSRWFDVEVSRMGDESLRRVAVMFRDITDRKRAEEQLLRAAEMDAFRVSLANALRPLSNPVDIQTTASRVLGEYLGANRVVYFEIRGTDYVVVHNYVNGVTPLSSSYPIDSFSAKVLEAQRTGHTISVSDVVADPDLSPAQKAAYAAIQIAAHIDISLVKGGEFVAGLAIHASEPREWTPDEITLSEEVAEYTWAAVERARAEAALRESEERLRDVLNSMTEGFALLGSDFTILDVNEETLRLDGRSRDELIGRTHWDAFPGTEDSPIGKIYARVARERAIASLEHEYLWPDGRSLWLDMRAYPTRNGGVAIFWRDVTDRKRAEAALRDSEIQRVQEQSARDQEHQRAESLAELDRAKTQFFSNISHEFRTPLTLILGPLEAALASLGEESADHDVRLKESLEVMQRNGLRLLKLVNMLLDFSRIEADRLQAHYEPTDLATYTAELASVFRSTIESANLQLVVDCPPLPEPIYIDREMWEKIVLNLLSNAFKFTFVGTITVSLKPNANQVELTISDTGTGIPASDLPHLFERFYQVKGVQGRSYEGSGIGLSLVEELVKRHSGTITVSSELNQGTSFTITLPAGYAHLPTQAVGISSQKGSTTNGIAQYIAEASRWLTETEARLPIVDLQLGEEFSGTSDPQPSSQLTPSQTEPSAAIVLIVDDNADMRDYLSRLLHQQYEVAAANDGLAALEAIAQQRPDLVIADVMMPRMDGLQLLRSLRENEQTKDIPIILLSARAGEAAKIEGLAAGADDYLIKPFSARELLAQIDANLKLATIRREVATQIQVTQAVQTLNASLERRVDERTAQLQAINQELEAFSYSVSHDLRTPLRYISSFAEQLSTVLNSDNEASIASRLPMLNIILRSALAAEKMVDALLEFSRAGQTEMYTTLISLNSLIQQVQAQLAPEMEGRVIHWQIAPLPTIKGDSTLLQLVLQNLLSNAVKYTRKRTPAEITIDSRETETEWIISVKDNGAGFDMKYSDRLFQLFQRLHTQEAFSGNGVGLANVRRIIHRHGGRTWAEGEIDQGATFYFTLPKWEELT